MSSMYRDSQAIEMLRQLRSTECTTSAEFFIRSLRTKFDDANGDHPCIKVDPYGWVQCDKFGKAQDWEGIRVHVLPPENGEVIVALQAWTGKYLTAYPNGDIKARAHRVDSWEKFVLEDHSPYIALKSKKHGKYLSCDNLFDCGKEVRANRDNVAEWELWMLVPQDQPDAFTNPGHTRPTVDVFMRSRRTKFATDGHPCMKVDPCGWVQSDTFGKAQDWEGIRVHIMPPENGKVIVALQAWTGKYFTAHPNGDVEARAHKLGSCEKFVVEDHSPYIALRSKEHGKYLSCDNLFECGKEVRANRDHAAEWEHWLLVPQDQPDAHTNPGHTARAAIAGTALSLGALLTFGALAIPAVGFGAAGVAAGSAAAAAQSALWGGATGGVFSLLQLMGATMAWAPAAALGAAAAAGGGAGTAANIQHEHDQDAAANEIRCRILEHHRE